MKTKRLFLSFIMLIVSVITLSGCANIEFIRAVDTQNVIIDKLVIEIDESKINKAGTDLTSVMNAISDDMIAFRQSVDRWKLNFIDYPEILTSLDKGIYVEVTPIKNKISLAIQFANWHMFGLFYGYTQIENFEYQGVLQDVGPFIDQILSKEHENEDYGLFLLKYSILKNSGIKHEIGNFEYNNTNYYEKYVTMTNNHYNLDDVDISQIFAYPDDRIHSNADESYVEGGMTFMQWNLHDKDENFQMEMYKYLPKSTWWYVLALVLSAIGVIGITIYIVWKYKNKPTEKITRWDVEKDGK